MDTQRPIRFTLTMAALIVGAASAADTFYLGTWKIASAAVAPWADKDYRPDTREMKTLMGKTITIAAKAIQGPRALACGGAKYEIKDYTADMLFQGAFGEMHNRNASADPDKLAAGMGFHGSR